MKGEILSLLLQAESEYGSAMRSAIREAEAYAGERRREQEAYEEELKREWHRFEEEQNGALEKALALEEERMEAEAIILKERMRLRQEEKADEISERLKEEVLSQLWR